MNTKYLYTLLCTFLFINCVHSNRIELSEIETRSQLDSVLALIPKDSVWIDSLPQRELRIALNGDFTLYGVPTNEVSFSLVREELSFLTVRGYTGFKTLLTNVENANGLGLYQNSTFMWDILDRQMELRNDFNWPDNLLEMSDKNDFVFKFTYYPHSKNPITDLVDDSAKGKSDYYLRFFSPCGYLLDTEFWLNGFRLANKEIAINDFLVSGGKQELKMLVSSMDENSFETSDQEKQAIPFNLYKRGKKLELIESYDVKLQKEQTFLFNIDIPQIHPKHVVDLRHKSNTKDRLYQCYEKLYNAFLSKDERAVVEIMLPYFRSKAVTHSYNKKEIYEMWRKFNHLVTNIKRVRLVDKSKLDVSFTQDGTLATLVTEGDGVLSVVSKEYISEYYTFYFYENENEEIEIYF